MEGYSSSSEEEDYLQSHLFSSCLSSRDQACSKHEHHKMNSVSHLPKLAESDFEIWTDYLGDYVDMWLRNGPRFFEDQKYKMVRLALYPFLFHIKDNLPHAWVNVLSNFGILERERGDDISLSSSEMESFEMAVLIFQRCADLTVESKNDLKEILNFIYDIEERTGRGHAIDVYYALEKLPELKLFHSIWAPIKRTFEKRKKRAHVCILYFFKTIHHQIVHYGKDGQDKSELVKKLVTDRAHMLRVSSGDTKSLTGRAHLAFKEGRYQEALHFYTQALKFDPLNSQLYSCRAETNIQRKNFVAALPDCWRSIKLDQRNSSKGYYQAAECYFELPNLEKALEMNELAREICVDPAQRKLNLTQAAKITKAEQELKISRRRGFSGSEVEHLEEEKTTVVFRKLQCEGSTLYQSKKFGAAADKFHQALEMVATHGLQALETHMEDILLLNYCYGLACIQTGIYSNLQCAIEKFNYVIGRTTDFPAAHYGLGLAYKKLNRFKEALKEFQLALERRKASHQLQWPQTLRAMEETDSGTLQKLLKGLIRECKHHPKPDAVCKFHSDGDNPRIEIYKSDPDYKGFIRLHCSCKCCVEFHVSCWKVYKHSLRERVADKEMLDEQCPTPNCWGFIVTLLVYRPDCEDPVAMTSTKEKSPRETVSRPIAKMKTTSALKLQIKEEKKLLRKKGRLEARKKLLEEQMAEEDAGEEPSAPADNTQSFAYLADEERDLRNLNEEGVLLKAKEPDVLLEGKSKQKVAKLKKKKEKTKQMLTFDLQFSADKDKELVGVSSLDDEGDFVNKPGLMGSSPHLPLLQPNGAAGGTGGGSLLPTPVAVVPPTGNGLLPLPLKPQPANDVFLQNLIECFVNILQGGPVELDSGIIKDVLGSVPGETRSRVAAMGGISAFLRSQPQFIVAGSRVGLAKGGRGLLGGTHASSGNVPNGPGLLKTPVLPGGGASARLAPHPWSGSAGVASSTSLAQQAQHHHHHQQQQQEGLVVRNFLREPEDSVSLLQQGGLNPTAQEFVPGVNKNSLSAGELVHDLAEHDEPVEELASCYIKEEEEEGEGEEDSNEFITVTRKKSFRGLPSTTDKSVNVMYNIGNIQGSRTSSSFREVTAIDNVPVGKIKNNSLGSTVIFHKPHSPLTTTTIATAAAAAAMARALKEKTELESSSSPSEAFTPSSSSSSTSAAATRLVVSGVCTSGDPSSSIPSEEVRASSPASCASHHSQGSGNSQASSAPTSSTGQQVTVCPPQPLKASGLNLPKRSKRRDLREKVVLRTGSQQINPQVLSHNSGSLGSLAVKPEVDDGEESVSSGTSDNRDPFARAEGSSLPGHAGVKDFFVGVTGSKGGKVFNGFSNPTGEESSGNRGENGCPEYQEVVSPPFNSGDHNSDSHKTQGMGSGLSGLDWTYGAEPMPSAAAAADTGFFPGMSDYGSSLDADIVNVGRTNYDRFYGELFGRAEERSSPPQTQTAGGSDAPGQRPAGSRVLRKLGLSSHSPSPPLTHAAEKADLTGCSNAASKPLTLRDGLFYNNTMETTTKAMQGLSSTRPGNFVSDGRPYAGDDLWDKPQSSYPLSGQPHFNAAASSLWSPLSSDTLRAERAEDDRPGEQGWPSSFGSIATSDDRSAQAERRFDTSVTAKLSDPSRRKAESIPLSSRVNSLPTTAAASVNTELTGEKLKALQQRFLEVKGERDSLRAQLKAEQERTEAEQALRFSAEERLGEREADLGCLEADLEESKRHARAVEEETLSLRQALQEVTSKAQQLEAAHDRMQQKASRAKTYEREIVNLNFQAAMTGLDTRRKEACGHMYKIGGLIHKIRTAGQVEDPSLKAKLAEWEDYVKACEKAIEELLESHKSSMQALDSGQGLEQLRPLTAPSLPPLPKPPSEQSMRVHPQPKAAPTRISPPQSVENVTEAPEDDASAFLKMIYQGSAAKQEDPGQATSKAEPVRPMRLPPGLPRRPLSQGPVPLNAAGVMSAVGRPPSGPSLSSSSSSSSSSLSSLSSVKLPSGRVAQPSLASSMASQSGGLNQSQQATGSLSRPEAQAAAPQQTSTFERLVQTIQETFPDYTRNQIQRLIEELRRENGGSLAGFSFEILARSIAERIMNAAAEETSSSSSSSRAKAPAKSAHQLPHHAEAGLNGRARSAASPSELTCTICHEGVGPDSSPLSIRTLDCGHRFHEKCIQAWLRVNQTCPNCRSHSLLEEDFPSLIKSVFLH